MSLHLADGVSAGCLLPPVGDLSAEAIAKRYKFGDQVAIVCRFLNNEPAFDAAQGRHLELKKLRYLRPASAEELSRIRASHPFGFPDHGNLLKGASGWIPPPSQPPTEPATGGNQSGVEHARAVNLAYMYKMPDFIADEIAESYMSATAGTPEWELQCTVESGITVRADHAS